MRDTSPLLESSQPTHPKACCCPQGTASSSTKTQKRHRRIAIGTCLLLLSIIALTILFFVGRHLDTPAPLSPQEAFVASVRPDNVVAHVAALWRVAQAHVDPGTGHASRSVLYGYNESAEYIEEVFAALTPRVHVSVSREYFGTCVWEEVAPPSLSVTTETAFEIRFVAGVDFQSLRYGGDGLHSLEENVFPVTGSGCTAEDFDGVAGSIALIADGECGYGTKGELAQAAGALGGIIYRLEDGPSFLAGRSSNQRVRRIGWLEGDPLVTIPFIASTWAVSQVILSNLQSPIRLVSHGRLSRVTTFNLIADIGGSEAGVGQRLMFGAHLDSAGAGPPPFSGSPGLNDNGSGSALLLELALQLIRSSLAPSSASRPVRFAWWGAEEDGLLGSYAHVARLLAASAADASGKRLDTDVVLEDEASLDLDELVYVNMDMMASPNGLVQVLNGSDVPTATVHPDILRASGELTDRFIRAFASQRSPDTHSNSNSNTISNTNSNTHSDDSAHPIPIAVMPMSGGSDFFPFIAANITSAALSTGASQLRSEGQRSTPGIGGGGLAGAQLDPCYHVACDTAENLDVALLEVMGIGLATVLADLISAGGLKTD